MKINYGGKTFLTDPMLASKGAYTGFLYRDQLVNPTAPLPMSIDEIMDGVDCILVSHSHIPADGKGGPSDHFDATAIKEIDKSMPIYIQACDAEGVRAVGFNNVHEIEDSITVDNIKITRFDGLHTDIEDFLPMVGDVSGFVFEADGYPTILWTGDTIITNEVLATIEKYTPDIIITHSGGAQMPIDAEGNVVKLVMDADDTIKIAQLVPKSKIVSIHMEALDHCPITRQELSEKSKIAGIPKDRLFIPDDGEEISL
jgi:L-ascorbate metabolism protein UlaG (beta-lactamase superfamily)